LQAKHLRKAEHHHAKKIAHWMRNPHRCAGNQSVARQQLDQRKTLLRISQQRINERCAPVIPEETLVPRTPQMT